MESDEVILLAGFGLLIGLLCFSGCAGAFYRTPCTIKGVTLRLEGSEEEAHRFCRGRLGSCPDERKENGERDFNLRYSTTSGGCADTDTKVLVITAQPQTQLHEIAHLLEAHCQ